MKKKITFFTLHLGYGGIEKAVSTLANELCNYYDIEIIATYKLYDKPVFNLNNKIKTKFLINNNLPLRLSSYKSLIKNHHFILLFKTIFKDYLKGFKINELFKDMKKSRNLLSKKGVRNIKEIKKCKSDIIISTTPYLNDLVGTYAPAKALKIGWEHNHPHNNKKYIRYVKETSKGLDKFIVVSDKIAKIYSKVLDCEVISIPNFLDNIPSKTSNLDIKNLVSVGRLSEEKGFADLVKVFYYVHQKDNDIVLNIVGDGQEKRNVESLIAKYNLQGSVIMHGFKPQSEINKLYRKCSLYLMTSYTESFGLVLAEAMSYGLPCLSFTSAEGANDIIITGVNGYLINNRNYEKMADQILEVLKDQTKLKALSKNARISCEKYVKGNVIKGWRKILG